MGASSLGWSLCATIRCEMSALGTNIRRMRVSYNRFWRDYGYHHGQVKLRNLPEVFAIESTNYCNLKCVMCPRGEPDIMTRPLGHMSDALFEKIFDDAKFYTDPCWFHWFGEPLMHPRLFEQIAYAKKRGVDNLGISTNATLLNSERAEAILQSPLDTIMIAIDGTSKEVYEKVRKSSSFTFERVCANVRDFLLLKKRYGKKTPHTILSIIVMEETKTQLAEFREEWTGLGADEILLKEYTTWANQSQEFIQLAPSEKRDHLAHARREFPCFFMWESVVIGWDGRVVPCCFDYDASVTLGDLNTQSLREIWNSERYVNLRRMELERRNDTPLCRNCNQAPGFARNPVWPLKPRQPA
jgi:radical SAM protein with 4Fe4S-binding SPASM domain